MELRVRCGIRDWNHAEDHSSAVWAILTCGRVGETYLVGADGERDNITVMRDILRAMGESAGAFDWVRDNEDWWRPAKEATEAKYAAQGQ